MKNSQQWLKGNAALEIFVEKFLDKFVKQFSFMDQNVI